MKYLPASEGFLGLDGGDSVPVSEAEAVIVPFGLEASVSYGGGTALGPRAILQASHQVELFDEEFWKEVYRDYGVATLDYPEISSCIPDALEQLADTINLILEQKKFPLVLGGEHSLTCLLYTSPSPRDRTRSRMPSSA